MARTRARWMVSFSSMVLALALAGCNAGDDGGGTRPTATPTGISPTPTRDEATETPAASATATRTSSPTPRTPTATATTDTSTATPTASQTSTTQAETPTATTTPSEIADTPTNTATPTPTATATPLRDPAFNIVLSDEIEPLVVSAGDVDIEIGLPALADPESLRVFLDGTLVPDFGVPDGTAAAAIGGGVGVTGGTVSGTLPDVAAGTHEIVAEVLVERGPAEVRAETELRFDAIETTPTPTSSNPVLQRTPDRIVRIAGLPGRSAHVAFDSLGIPHIYADDRRTATFVQGYETAKVRFWQMDIFRRAAEGRLSEIFGSATRSMDAEMRTVFTTRDGRRIEEALWERLDAEAPDLAELANAFADGVNAWLGDLRAGRNGVQLPPEHRLFSVTPEELADWRPQDSIAIGRLQAYFLSETLDAEIGAAELLAALPEPIFRDTIRSAPAAPATVLPPGGGGSAASSDTLNPTKAKLPGQSVLRALREMFERNAASNPLGNRTAPLGSNNWIIAPELSQTGHAMLANDPHLQLFNPAIWHMVQLDIESQGQVTGVNFPGLPGVILGHNDFGAWGGTVAVFDVTDVYIESVTTPFNYPRAPRTVLFNDEQVEVLRIEEQIGISGGSAATIVIEIVPHHGPMVPDPNLDDDIEGLAATEMTVRWTGHEVSLDSRFLNNLILARNVEEFKEAVRSFAVGAQNWVWADVHGDIAYFPYVLVPQRPPGTVPYLPLDGTGGAEWLQDGKGNVLWLEEEKFPQALNPPQGFLATANNDQIGNTLDNDPLNDEVYLTFTADLGFREQRIQQVLSDPPAGGFTAEDLSALQNDTVSLEASRLVPFLFAAAEARPELVSAEMQDALDRLQEWGEEKPDSPAWDMRAGVDPAEVRDDVPPRDTPIPQEELDDAVAASLFAGWSTRVSRATLTDDFAAFGLGVPGGDDATKTLLHILEDIDSNEPGFIVHTKGDNGESTLWDDRTTEPVETRDEILLTALDDALDFLAGIFASDVPSEWLWGKVHQVRFQHFLGTAGIDFLDLGNFPAPGGRFTVNPAEYSLNANAAASFVFSGGPSKRFVAVLDPDGVRSVSSLPGGNNGDPCLGKTPQECGASAADFNAIKPDIHYGDHVPGWIRGETFEYRVTREAVAADTEELIRYLPRP